MLEKLNTEKRNKETMNLDQMPVIDILRVMNKEDEQVIEAIHHELDAIEQAVQRVIHTFKNGGRLIYVGAGTSGRLGVLDAVECVPTFDTSFEMVQGLIAGGEKAFVKAVEGAEDDMALGRTDLEKITLTNKDTVIGIAASGRTPYVIGALEYADSVAASTVSISCNIDAEMSKFAQVAIELETGPEVLTGSTRLKAGSAQKMVLNMISTAAMTGIGKVYQNLMVDLKPTNKKLQNRSIRIIMDATEVDYQTASDYYEAASHHVKTAIVMITLSCTADVAIQKIEKANGFVREAIKK